jgi:hypothetical protein
MSSRGEWGLVRVLFHRTEVTFDLVFRIVKKNPAKIWLTKAFFMWKNQISALWKLWKWVWVTLPSNWWRDQLRDNRVTGNLWILDFHWRKIILGSWRYFIEFDQKLPRVRNMILRVINRNLRSQILRNESKNWISHPRKPLIKFYKISLVFKNSLSVVQIQESKIFCDSLTL